jgi:hypothetical protein
LDWTGHESDRETVSDLMDRRGQARQGTIVPPEPLTRFAAFQQESRLTHSSSLDVPTGDVVSPISAVVLVVSSPVSGFVPNGSSGSWL